MFLYLSSKIAQIGNLAHDKGDNYLFSFRSPRYSTRQEKTITMAGPYHTTVALFSNLPTHARISTVFHFTPLASLIHKHVACLHIFMFVNET